MNLATVATVVAICVGIATLLGSGITVGAYWMKSTVDKANSKLRASFKDEMTSQTTNFTAQMTAQTNTSTTQMALLTKEITGQTLSFQSLKTDIMDRIDTKLDEYVRRQTFNDYKESHSREHVDLEKELGALRQFKHDTNSMLRGHEIQIHGLDEKIGRLETRADRSDDREDRDPSSS